MMRWLAIANPGAGKPGTAERIGAALFRDGLVHDVVVSVAPGDGATRARQAATFDGIVAIGGDGTIASILAGLDLSRQQLAVIPAGHGNCFARDLGAATLNSAVDVLRRGATRMVDLLRVTLTRVDGKQQTLWAASTLALGYLTDVVALGRRRFAGLGSHAYTAATPFVRPRRTPMRIAIDGADAITVASTGLVINNTAHLAYYRPFQGARVDDGRLDLLVLDRGWIGQLGHNVALAARTRAFTPAIVLQGGIAEIDLPVPRALMIDGEMMGEVIRMEATCVAAALRCRAQ